MDSSVAKLQSTDRISLRELLGVLWAHRWIIVIATILVTAGVGLLSVTQPKKYVATVVIAPVSDSTGNLGGSSISSLLSQMGGIASLAGVYLPGGNERSENVAILESEGLTEKFIQTNALIPVLAKRSHAVRSIWTADDYFRKRIRQVTTDPKTGLVSLSITWTDPQLAAVWANNMVLMTNEYIRGKAIAETQRNIAYLNEQAAKTDAVGVKQAVYSLMEQEIKKQMLARGSEEFALKVIDQAIAPERATSPRPLFWTAGAFVGCLAAAFMISLCWIAWRNN